jgi:hypothetical protein
MLVKRKTPSSPTACTQAARLFSGAAALILQPVLHTDHTMLLARLPATNLGQSMPHYSKQPASFPRLFPNDSTF